MGGNINMGMISDLFGYLLNALYNMFNNYGIAIIVFSLLLRVMLLPITFSQQKSMKKNEKIQAKLKEIQKKYKNNPEKLNQETMELYKSEKMSPFSGCLSGIIQIVLILSVFWLVSQPLTHMRHVQNMSIYQEYINKIKEKENKVSYIEIAVINNASTDYKEIENSLKNEEIENKEELENKKSELSNLILNMNFLGLDLSKVPTQSLEDFRVYIIPLLYVISSFLSIKLTSNLQKGQKKDIAEKKQEGSSELDAMQDATKFMPYMILVTSVSIAFIAPLGLALYWLVSNILMILERIIIQKIVDSKEENENA